MTPGPQGENGQSAYELWKSQEGNSDKTEDDFLNSLKGEKEKKGMPDNKDQKEIRVSKE